MLLNDGWMFALGEPRDFVPVQLPHDWLIGDLSKTRQASVGWYARELDVSDVKAGQRVFLQFDGVYMDSALYVNGRPCGEWKYGYTRFIHDITDCIFLDRPNALLMRVNYQPPCERWYSGAGITRDVSLIIKNACHFVPDGIYIHTEKTDAGWTYTATAEVETGGRPYAVRHEIADADGPLRAWDVNDPVLYTLRSTLIVGEEICDTVDTRFGFRETRFDPNEGFFLNGRHLKMNGVCLHHDLGGLGAAVHGDAIRRQLTILRQMGVNAIRTAHNPPAKVFMDLADEMGFLVLSELLDMWEKPKNTYDYARFFNEWVERDAASWIRRDRNHPSVVLWSVGNEIHDTHLDAVQGGRTLNRLLYLVKLHDPLGNAPATLCSNYMPWENTQICMEQVGIAGYNYGEALYERHHAAHPGWVIYGSETCSTVQSRGVYHFPLSQSVLADDDLQCSALGNSTTSWGARSVEACIMADLNTPYSLGQFIWAGQDYIGEPTPYHTKNCYFGHIDTAGFKKDSYYLFQAAWLPKSTPVLHLYPYWDFSPGQAVDVRVVSNADSVALFLNGEEIGRQRMDGRLAADFRVAYRAGTLRAVAYGADGVQVKQVERRSFGDSVSLRLDEDRYGELTFVTITAVDADGNPVENANRRVRVAVENGALLCLDNGDSTDWEPYRADSRRMFSGKLLAVARGSAGKKPRVTAFFDGADIPVRKVELVADGFDVTARVFPPDATDRRLVWRLTDAAGIDSPLGTLAVAADGHSARITPRGDGTVYVRCSPLNGREHPAFISQITLDITGYGKPFLDPYGFIAGGLYNACNVPLTNGNERGVATLRDGESHAGFAGLDFGPFGSDTITLPLFPLSHDPFDFEVWEGMPLSGGQRIAVLHYGLGSTWNTYKDVTYTLPRRLRGVTTLCFVFRQKVHIKGFRFARQEKAYARLAAACADSVYGDSFTVRGDTIERIGNNVTLTFDGMDFARGASRVRLRWRSDLEKNAVQVAFAGESGAARAMVSLPRAKDWAEAEFALSEVFSGPGAVSLIFFPGCALDLAWVEFLP